MTLTVVANIVGGRIHMRRIYKNLCPATVSASIMAVNMWKNSLKSVESDNNKILYELKLNSVALVRERTIPTERPPPVGEVSANFCG